MIKSITESAYLRRIFLKSVLFLYFLMVLALLYGVTFTLISSFQYSGSYKQVEAGKGNEKGNDLPELVDLKAQGAFLEARSRLVEFDSLSLTVNLNDSLVTLEQKGVILHTAKISSISNSRVFGRIRPEDLSAALSAPFAVHEAYATIAKKRYNVKIAPADTSASAPMVAPDTSSVEPVCFILSLDRGIQLDFRQAEPTDDRGFKDYKKEVNRRESRRILNDLLAFKVPSYHPVIKLEIPEKDARAIYKAIPVNARVALRI